MKSVSQVIGGLSELLFATASASADMYCLHIHTDFQRTPVAA